MRIIAGEFRGRRLVAPPGRDTRPMLDRVREAMFSTLGAWLPEGRVLDLYSGTGSIGLEALSRGAAYVRFVERAGAARRALQTNVDTLDVHDRVDIQAGSALDRARWAPPRDFKEPGWADLILMDPPYPHAQHEPERSELLEAVTELVEEVLAPEGLLVLHTAPRAIDAHHFPERWDCERRVYGRSALWYLQMGQSDSTNEERGDD